MIAGGRTGILLALALTPLGGLGACGNGARQPVEDDTTALETDTLRGRVAVTGAEPATRLVLRTADGPVNLTGAAASLLRNVDGLEVRVAGSRDADDAMRVEAFRVRGLGELPAVDGVVRIEEGAAVLTTASGERLRFPRAPTALRQLEGQHVWIAGVPGRAPEQWGVIRARPPER